MSDNLPPLSHLQFAVLDALGTNILTGKQLRENLAANGIKKSGPSFYQLMARLEESKMVEGWYDQKIVEGQIIKERHYRITGEGRHALHLTANFYRFRLNTLNPCPA